MNIQSFSAEQLVESLIALTGGDGEQSANELAAAASKLTIADIVKHIQSLECNKPQKDLRQMSNEELREVKIYDLLHPLVKDDVVKYVDGKKNNELLTPIRIQGEPTMPYIYRLEAILSEQGIKTIGDLLDKQISGELKIGEAFAQVKKSIDGTVSRIDNSCEIRKEEVTSVFKPLEKLLTLKANPRNLNVQQFYQQIKEVETLVEKVNKKFEAKENGVLWAYRVTETQNQPSAYRA
jgi:hypothetical protein